VEVFVGVKPKGDDPWCTTREGCFLPVTFVFENPLVNILSTRMQKNISPETIATLVASHLMCLRGCPLTECHQ